MSTHTYIYIYISTDPHVYTPPLKPRHCSDKTTEVSMGHHLVATNGMTHDMLVIV